MKTLKKILPYAVALTIPILVLAQVVTPLPSGTQSIVTNIKNLVNNVIPILLIIGTVVFLWGVILYLTAGADEEKRANARSLMIYGLVGLFVMVAVWGIVNVLVGFFGITGTGIPERPGDIREI
ncbi:hypothetical protein A2757_00065 [Candidatus Giovannonibacteria bacterium RIFCSPHIGHO2_01_FULL_48_47]|nr:MAG: hypothetical protein A2757_00065 [Candidatus Giovannonibacteria bacterium RIFCSPHIGHO2_01_FULL_48_47]OGF68564.1 MAG: hypothetical protein A3D61_03825 [Candidatus Giovannonibacteria bacterium RIFCSPHIGHO2_02_FULL_48_15]OGF90039.1 MAG: hypothetical protein A3B26_00270 [Candidatus Giovannonibacteria bacterium RIFCSPLOWO2_01_FULL_48_47]OGF94691.1 MAG: hypothetical protein A2433_03465 [Candidatus Giovannonibacteria bacterium RIFOXYC1_FULL_48_8]OGF96240.1 MAG: hypothetical protein A2613_01535